VPVLDRELSVHATPPPDSERDESAHEPADQPLATSSLRGTFVFVMIMTLIFVGTWFGMFAIAMSRR
jgi:hypothetical protein